MDNFKVILDNSLNLTKAKTRGKVYGYPFKDIVVGDDSSYAVVPLENDGNFGKIRTRITKEFDVTFGGKEKGFHPTIVEHELALTEDGAKSKYAVVWLGIHPKANAENAAANAEEHNAAIEAASNENDAQEE